MKKIASVVVMLSLVAVLFTACGGGSEADNALLGTWSMDTIEVAGETISMDSEEAAMFEEINYTFTFKNGGKIAVTVMGLEEEGTYKLDGTNVLVDGENLGLTFENDVLAMSDSGMTITFKKA